MRSWRPLGRPAVQALRAALEARVAGEADVLLGGLFGVFTAPAGAAGVGSLGPGGLPLLVTSRTWSLLFPTRSGDPETPAPWPLREPSAPPLSHALYGEVGSTAVSPILVSALVCPSSQVAPACSLALPTPQGDEGKRPFSPKGKLCSGLRFPETEPST